MKKLLLMLAASMACNIVAAGVTFKVSVPEGTQKCYVCGDFNGWDVETAPELEKIETNLFTVTLDDVSSVSNGYKYLCGRDWLYVEKDAAGEEVDNRTSIGDPDIVGSWRSVPEYGIESVELTVNNVKRLIKIYLPDDYEQSTATYPVIYYNTLQQRYGNAGDDNNPGDYFFGQNSWNAHSRMENIRDDAHPAYIMVQVCSFLGENTPAAHNDYIGTGEASHFLNAFASDLIPYIEDNYRVAKGAENTTLVGADYGALFSLYASMTRPDLFGTCVAMSPMLWINPGEFEGMVGEDNKNQTYYLSVGSLEPSWIRNDTQALSESINNSGIKSYFTVYPDARHNDASWGESFHKVLDAMSTQSAPNVGTTPDDDDDDADTDFAERIYTLHSASNVDYLLSNLKGQFTYTEDYRKSGTDTPVKALVFTQEIDSKYQSSYYWRIGIGEDGSEGWLNEMGTIGFSDKRTRPAWQNTAIFEDGTIYNIAAMDNGFTVQAASGKVTMTKGERFISSATVSFPSADKGFTIHFGSVNSGSDQGAVTPTITVSDNCTKADITYDFSLNKVTIVETETGGAVEQPEKPDFKTRSFTLYAGEDQSDMKAVGYFSFSDDYRRKGSDEATEAMIITHEVDASYKSKYYWNIAEGDPNESGWLLSAPKDITFSSSHSTVSWLNVAIYEDETVDNIAVHSQGFKVVNGNNKYDMKLLSGHTSTATVPFNGTDKTFTVNFGSVNSASDQGPVTPTLSVSANCLEAVVTYDFDLNKATVQETKYGDVASLPKVESMSAVPAVAVAGSDVDVNIQLSTDAAINVTCTFNQSQNIAVSPVKGQDNLYTLQLKDVNEGIYTLTASLADGTSSSEINIRVLCSGKASATPVISANAYDGINWDTTGRYKGNFHTHTAQSFDTSIPTSTVVDRYHNAGYTILALTDHDANPYPWSMFDLYDPQAEARYPESMGMLAIPGNELSKDRRNNWSESTGGEFNHHNDFFTGRQGQEFMSLRESYAYTHALGGLQIINHPGQYWNLSTTYKAGEKNSPEWHAENFMLYPSLIGLEVYNQGNRRPNDRILWDQILSITMPGRPVWGYSCDDTHTDEQYFRNYQYMLMSDLSVDALKEAMNAGSTVFSYEYTGSGEAKAPHINSITIDDENNLITIDTDDSDNIEWIYSTHRTGSTPSTEQSTVVGTGKTFDYTGFQGSYVRARLTNQYGETATQPFGFTIDETTAAQTPIAESIAKHGIEISNDIAMKQVKVKATEGIERISVVSAAGAVVKYIEGHGENTVTFSTSELGNGVYVIVVATDYAAYTGKITR